MSNNIIICYSKTFAHSMYFERTGITKHLLHIWHKWKRNKLTDTETGLRLPSGRQAGEGRTGSRDQQMLTLIYETGKWQGPTIEHRELYSISWDKPSWERMWKRLWIHVWLNHSAAKQKLAQHCTSTIFQLNTFKRKKLESIHLILLFICIARWHIFVKHDTVTFEVIGKVHLVL